MRGCCTEDPSYGRKAHTLVWQGLGGSPIQEQTCGSLAVGNVLGAHSSSEGTSRLPAVSVHSLGQGTERQDCRLS